MEAIIPAYPMTLAHPNTHNMVIIVSDICLMVAFKTFPMVFQEAF